MCGNIRSQWKYLSTIYYHNKKHLPKWLAKIVATIVLPFVRGFYRGVNIIATYPDARLRRTMTESFKELDNNTNIMIFPENSSDGYHQILTEYFTDFLVLAR